MKQQDVRADRIRPEEFYTLVAEVQKLRQEVIEARKESEDIRNELSKMLSDHIRYYLGGLRRVV